MDVENRSDPLATLFPHVAKCSLKQISVTGDLEPLFAKCSLVQNVMVEQFFIISWILFLVLGILAIVRLAFFLLMAIVPLVGPTTCTISFIGANA